MGESTFASLTKYTDPELDDEIYIQNDPNGSPDDRRCPRSDVIHEALPWIDAKETWTYASATTITVPSDATDKYQVGDKFKLTANSVVLQGYIVGVASTTLTVVGDALTNHTFTNNYYSNSLQPFEFDGYFDFTPTWTNLTVGNGTVIARYNMDGRRVFGEINLTFGSTTSVSGQIEFAPPITAKADFDYQAAGGAKMVDSGTALYQGILALRSGTGRIEVRAIDTSGSYSVLVATSSSVPFTWTTGDLLSVQFEYYV